MKKQEKLALFHDSISELIKFIDENSPDSLRYDYRRLIYGLHRKDDAFLANPQIIFELTWKKLFAKLPEHLRLTDSPEYSFYRKVFNQLQALMELVAE